MRALLVSLLLMTFATAQGWLDAPAPSPELPEHLSPKHLSPKHLSPGHLSPGHLRGMWVDAYGEGFKTPAEIDALIRDAQALNLNALFVQVVRRGDCYCLRASLPVSDDPALEPAFDPLETLIERAHAADLQVHAWVVTLALWGGDAPPQSAAHAYNLHGPSAAEAENWLNVRYDGATRPQGDVYLDPGVPAVADYLAEAVVSLINNYDVDGVTFDRLRYPDFNDGSAPSWGYNKASLARFAAETGVDGLPHPTDETWTAWRREQLTRLMRRLYLEAKRADPTLWVGAATIAYGAPPESFADSHAYRVVLQDWAGWLGGGFLDLNLLMNYKSDADPEAAAWFGPWNRYALTLQGSAATAVATGIYLNDLDGTLTQVAAVAADAALAGWVGYSYRTPSDGVASGWDDPEGVRGELAERLTAPTEPFAEPAPFGGPPPVTALLGRVEADGVETVELLYAGEVVEVATTDSSGHYGFVLDDFAGDNPAGDNLAGSGAFGDRAGGPYLLRLEGGVAIPAPVRLGRVVPAPTLTRTWVAIDGDETD